MKAKIDALKLTREQSRQAKLTDAQIVEIRQLYASGTYSQYQLADMYKVSRSTIRYAVNPEAYEQLKQRAKERYRTNPPERRSKEYYRTHQQDLRNYKRKLLQAGEKFKET